MKREFERQKADLLKEIRTVLQDIETLYDEGTELGAEEVKHLRTKLQHRLDEAQARLQELEARTIEQVKYHAKVADDYINEKPYYAMGFAALAGLVIGVLLNRR